MGTFRKIYEWVALVLAIGCYLAAGWYFIVICMEPFLDGDPFTGAILSIPGWLIMWVGTKFLGDAEEQRDLSDWGEEDGEDKGNR